MFAGDFIAPDEVSEGTGWDRQPFDNPLVREMEDGTYTTIHLHLH